MMIMMLIIMTINYIDNSGRAMLSTADNQPKGCETFWQFTCSWS